MVCVFDLGNVLVFHYQERFFSTLAAACRDGAPAKDLFSAAFRREDVGRGGDLGRVYTELVEAAGLRLSREEFRVAFCDIFEANPPMVEFVARLSRPRVLLSNTNEAHVTWIAQRFPDVFPLFDRLVFSNEVRLAKPEPAIYRHVEGLTKAPPEHLVFIDDVEDYVEGARARGWQGVVFAGVGDCRRQLAALGVTPTP